MPFSPPNDVLRRAACILACALLLPASLAAAGASVAPAFAMQQTAQDAAHAQPGIPLKPDALAALLPATVFFQGRTAALQMRNAAAVPFAKGAIVWAALVDSSGYATATQEKYQFYLVTECPLRFGNARIPAGVYGGGFIGDHFILMDVGGHTIAQGPTQLDAAYPRPRPLQMLPVSPSAVKLMLGRHWVNVEAASTP